MIEAVIRRERAIIVTALLVMCALAWLYLLRLQPGMSAMDHGAMAMPMMEATPAAGLIATMLMWAIMMVAMMLPSAAPMILFFSSIQRTRHSQQSPFIGTGYFAASYVLVWIGFAIVAGTIQWALNSSAVLSPEMTIRSRYLTGVVLILTGVYQWSRLKHICLTRCRSPLSFIMTEWREGRAGALIMGLRHGMFCVGCCWLLMALLFVGGVMNLVWVAALSAAVLAEKLLPQGDRIGRVVGAIAFVSGVVLLAHTAWTGQ